MKSYKIKNGNISFEYEVESRLDKIEKLLINKDDDLLCGALSTVIANYASVNMETNGLCFVGYLILSFLVLKILFVGLGFIRMLVLNHKKIVLLMKKR